ncbi:hypothetical protein RhiirA5_415624 [Rhizophagus irregularis]|uniref:Transposase domain-containing protein n=1 Tax=Rhizophagus irregularis TaxID=588596 RepID=A0A2N0PRJ8_9GLOM|nr:hypothetical protein RhiirA5_415624 [Rhizophagus irregularis]PKC69296.1 hypothetical protein RhiirA1_456193 [Rhizophagus irregularis]
MIYRDNLHDIAFDIIRNGRYHHKTTLQFATVRNAQSQTERDLLATEFGIRKKPSIFDKVTRDHHLQCPHDAFYCVGGLAREMLQATFQTFSTIGENAFLEIWHNFEFPPTWSRQQNPITHLGSYFFSDCLCLCMIMPFLIYRAISNTAMLNKAFVEHLIKEFSEIGYNDLQQRIMQWAMQIAKIFPNISQLPNFHILRHFVMHAKNFATLINTAVSTKEMIHRIYKGIIPHSNKKNIEMDFVRCDNCLQTLRFLLDGGVDERYNGTAQFNFSILSKDQCVRSLLDSWYILPSITNLEQEDEISQITCMHENFINVRVQGKYNKYELQAANLEQSLNDDLLAELIHAYQEELGCTEHLATRKIKYFKSISYTIVDKDDQVDVNLRVGDIVDVLEDISSDGINDPKLDCSHYRFQRLTDRTWRRIYAIKWVDHQPNVHFVHQCKTGCYDGEHDETNVYYLYNDFYYNAI